MFKFLLTRYLKKREDEVWSVYEMFGGPHEHSWCLAGKWYRSQGLS